MRNPIGLILLIGAALLVAVTLSGTTVMDNDANAVACSACGEACIQHTLDIEQAVALCKRFEREPIVDWSEAKLVRSDSTPDLAKHYAKDTPRHYWRN